MTVHNTENRTGNHTLYFLLGAVGITAFNYFLDPSAWVEATWGHDSGKALEYLLWFSVGTLALGGVVSQSSQAAPKRRT